MSSLSLGPAPGYSLGSVSRMELIKLRSLRSTWWALGFTVAAAIGIGIIGIAKGQVGNAIRTGAQAMLKALAGSDTGAIDRAMTKLDQQPDADRRNP